MRSVFIYSLVLLLSVAIFVTLVESMQSPEKLILGAWNERDWQYEKVYTQDDLWRVKNVDTMAQSVKDHLGKHLVIHVAETWQFKDDGTLLLLGADTSKQVKWKLKGRGHILELEYDDKMIEHYNLTELSEDEMVLNFDSEIQVRGIAKLVFDRGKRAKKIQ